ncbi:PAAR domain-containing protein [Ralstonia wenshanensis]|uniref:PAAR domain-containing protein n=1 Tax=Ralstonia wenshanensis TaxID=2842456 RepID=UPI0021B33588|nr:PAAR domain-containing protein [Ralstonia wenshanensis]MCT7304628.1 PAAR domain-containing protein [Ralstonia wenshanensis]
MSAEIIRVGDSTDHGGIVLNGIPSTDLDGRPMAGVGNMVSCPKCSGSFAIVEGAAHYTVNGVQIALSGMKTACGAVLLAGNHRARVNG